VQHHPGTAYALPPEQIGPHSSRVEEATMITVIAALVKVVGTFWDFPVPLPFP
jgi:hypothetical protein